MASLIPGYECDIFISYRQNDNKYDGWVTEFVDNLKKELEANIKDKVSVYFDINPTDGLLETDSVDKSLADKLKCLIFIPIISRTYCDPKSYAWQHEFCAFSKLAKEDKFGRDIRLGNGNVASRILPVKIHDLDLEDKTLLENELGGVLRGIEFIYKEAGVDRPLTSKDNEEKNLNKTSYRNQINKVALAIKEIFTAIKHKEIKPEPTPAELSVPTSIPKRDSRIKILTGLSVILLLLVLGILFIPKLIKPKERLEKSIAVLPFRNLTNDSTQLYFCDGFMEEILNNLQKVNSFSVRSRTSSDLYRDTKKPITDIGKELNANYLIEGSVGREGNSLKIWVQLIDAKADKHIWSNDYNRELKQVLVLQSEIAKDIASELKTILTPEEKQLIEKGQTENLEAYDLYMQGRYFWNKRGETNLKLSKEYFEKSLTKDPDYALAYSGLADVYNTQTNNNLYKPVMEGLAKAKDYALRAIALDKNIAEPHTTLGAIYYTEMKWEEARKEFLVAIKLNPNYAETYYVYAQLLDVLRQNKEARINIDKAIKLSPFIPNYFALSSNLYYRNGKFNESLNEYLKLLELDSQTGRYTHQQGFLIHVRLGNDLMAIESLQKFFIRNHDDTIATRLSKEAKEVYKKSGINGILSWLIEINPSNYRQAASYYGILGNKDLAIDYLEKAFENPGLRFFSINNDYDLQLLRSDTRFQAIIKQLGLSDYQVPN